MFYDYKCDSCELTEVYEHSMLESPEFKCLKCGKIMRRVISGGSGVIFNGQGWVSKGSGLFSNPKKITKEVGVKVNAAYADAVNPNVAHKK